jgi:serine/threonine protein kinase
MDDFSILKVLGKGAFGKVMLVKKKDDKNNNLYALKTLRKAEIVKRGQVEHTKTERVVLERINCPFLVHLVYAFQTTEKLYMVLEYSGGGELFFWIKKQHRFSESRARLYAAEVLLAVAAMHKENIIHRDLKPENILCVPPPPSLLSSLHFPTLTLTLTPFSRLLTVSTPRDTSS